MSKKRTTLADQIRRAIDDSGMSRYAICKATGIDQAALSRFMSGKVGLMLASLESLAGLLELEIKSPKRKRRKAR